jgi:hypothetical protein
MDAEVAGNEEREDYCRVVSQNLQKWEGYFFFFLRGSEKDIGSTMSMSRWDAVSARAGISRGNLCMDGDELRPITCQVWDIYPPR